MRACETRDTIRREERGGFGADADALRQFDRMTRASRGPDASFDPAAFRKQMERDGRWKRATRE